MLRKFFDRYLGAGFGRKGQLLSQPLFWIFALVVLSVIFLVGYRAIGSVLETGEIVEYRVLRDNIEDVVDSVYSSGVGTVSAKRLIVPSSVRAVCFADNEGGLMQVEYEDVNSQVRLLRGSNNVFYSYLGESDIPEDVDIYYYVPHLKPEKNPLCFDNIDGLRAVWENKGRYVEVRQKG